MYNQVIVDVKPLGFTWDTADPFLFCVHHLDRYPPGNDALGPAASLEGRNLGQDFTVRDGWRMYHGTTVPGFPAHPHRGFETVTVVLEGFVDHSDSHGAAGRYGEGDVQWMTAGAGLQHCEMFPLTRRDAENPLELFQIWLNLPAERKFAAPHYKMLWVEDIPTVAVADETGKHTEVVVVAGRLGDAAAPDPAPDSWAADPANEVSIWKIAMEAGARWTLPAASPEVRRRLYYYRGAGARIAGIEVGAYQAVELLAEHDVIVESLGSDAGLLLLQGLPISEPVAQYGPFVMNQPAEIHEAVREFRRTRFGGWPWDRADNVHPRDSGRFARYADGSRETR